MIDLSQHPFPVTYRELWLPRAINTHATLQSSVQGGHALALTGARKATTSDGVHFNSTATSYMSCGFLHDGAARIWFAFRFKLDVPLVAGLGVDRRLAGKLSGANDLFELFFENSTGRLYFRILTAGVSTIITSVATSWLANTWYQVFVSLSPTAGLRMRIDGGAAVTSATIHLFPPFGDNIYFGDETTGSGWGLKGVMSDIFIDEPAADLTEAQELEIYKGILPSLTTDNMYLCDEGRGVTVYDRGAGAANATLGAGCTWSFGQVKQPLLSLDGRNDHAQSSAGVDITGAVTIALVTKMKSTYNALTGDHYPIELFIDNNTSYLLWYNFIIGQFRYMAIGAGASGVADFTYHPAIDDYAVWLMTQQSGVLKLYLNGYLAASGTWTGAMPGANAIAYIGAEDSPSMWDISRPLFAGLISGAFTNKQALAYSRWLRDVFNLPISI